MMYVNLFWVWGHPEVYILVLPDFGIFSEVSATFSGKPLFGYCSMVGATIPSHYHRTGQHQQYPGASVWRAHRIPGARRVARDHGQLEREYGGTHRADEFAYAALTGGPDPRAGCRRARGMGYSRQGRYRASPRVGVGSSPLQGSPHCGAVLARKGQALPLTVLGEASRADRRGLRSRRQEMGHVYVGRRMGADLVYAGIGWQVMWQHA